MGRALNSVLSGDVFAQNFQFRLPNGHRKHHSVMGCLMTVILLVAIMSYGAMKSIELVTYDETDIMLSSRGAFFDSDYVHTPEEMWYAFGLSSYDEYS